MSQNRSVQLEKSLGSYLLRPHGVIEALAAHPDGNSLWVLSRVGVSYRPRTILSRWSVRSGAQLSSQETQLSMQGASLSLEGSSPIITAQGGVYQSKTERIEPISSGEGRAFSMSADLRVGLYSYQGRLFLWPSGRDERPLPLQGPVERFCILPDASGFLSSTSTSLEGWILQPQRKLLWFSATTPSKRWRKSLSSYPLLLECVSPSLGLVLFGDGSLVALDPQTGKEQWELLLPLKDPYRTKIAFARQAERIAVITGKEVYFLSLEGGLLSSIECERSVRKAALAPDASWMAVVDDSLSLVSLSQRELFLREGHGTGIVGLQWFGDSKRLLSAAQSEPAVRLWDCDAASSSVFLEARGDVSVLQLSPDESATFLLQRSQKEAALLSFDREGLAQEASRHLTKPLNSLTLSPDGAWLYFLEQGPHDLATEKLLGHVEGAYNDPFKELRAQKSQTDRDALLLRYRVVALSLTDPFAEPIQGDTYYQDPFGLQSSHRERLWVFCESKVASIDPFTGKQSEAGTLQEYRRDKNFLRLQEGFVLQDQRTIISRVLVRGEEGLRFHLCRWRLLDGAVEWTKFLCQADDFRKRLPGRLWISSEERWGVTYDHDTIRFFSVVDGTLLHTLFLEEVSGEAQITTIEVSKDERRVAVGTARGVILLFRLVGFSS